jgi:hypothetical protein
MVIKEMLRCIVCSVQAGRLTDWLSCPICEGEHIAKGQKKRHELNNEKATRSVGTYDESWWRWKTSAHWFFVVVAATNFLAFAALQSHFCSLELKEVVVLVV